MYQNEHGSASRESQEIYTSNVRILSVVVLLISSLGLIISAEHWPGQPNAEISKDNTFTLICESLLNYAWILMLGPAVLLFNVQDPNTIGRTATTGAVLGVGIVISKSLVLVAKVNSESASIHSQDIVYLGTAAALTTVLLCFPKHPTVFLTNGRVVDRQFSVSLLNRYTLSWCSDFLAVAGRGTKISLDDFPALDGSTRAANLATIENDSARPSRLWQRTLLLHYAPFLKLWTFVIVRSVLSYGPSYSVMRLLENLNDYAETGNLPVIWFWVVVLGGFSISVNIVDYQVLWIQYGDIGIKYEAQLLMAIFRKNLKRKITEETNLAKAKSKKNGNSPVASRIISQDIPQLAKFAANNYLLPQTILKLGIGLVFLLRLLGWQSVLVGLLVNVIFVPLNAHVAQKQAVAQKGLTLSRDQKTKAFAEAFNALRQIKYCASEKQWEQHLMEFRQDEMENFHALFMAKTWISFCRIAGPVLYAAALLSAYVCTNRSITAAIAFTAINLAERTGELLALIPVLVSEVSNARVQSGRVDEFLDLAERGNRLQDHNGNQVWIRDATISWPSSFMNHSSSQSIKSDLLPNKFSLHDVNIEFPVGELSIISGKTGSGKTLLLTAILGEAELTKGSIKVPSFGNKEFDKLNEELSFQGQHGPASIAYVSQKPWLRSMSIRENILFGLPLVTPRYEKVLTACALRHDLATLPDGDNTEVGIRGTTLSGGQRWRVTLARALYSGSQLMILEDILSALDAHVRQEILNALTGELGKGRTRILATHHASICLEKAKYAVFLSDGKVTYAGTTEQMPKSVWSKVDRPDATSESPPLELGDSLNMPAAEANSKVEIHQATDSGQSWAMDDTKPSWKVLKQYASEMGAYFYWSIFISSLLVRRLLVSGNTWLLKKWTQRNSKSQMPASQTLPKPRDEKEGDMHYYMYLYFISSMALLVVELLYSYQVHSGSLRASKAIFRKMTSRVLRMPLRWIDTVPRGHILRSFTRDIADMDRWLMEHIVVVANRILSVLMIFFSGLYTSSYTATLSLVLLAYSGWVSNMYVRSQKAIKPYRGKSLPDLLDHYSSSASGLATVRAFKAEEIMMNKMCQLVDNNSTQAWYYWLCTRWMALRFALAGSFLTIMTAMILVLSDSVLDASLMGFALSFTSQFAAVVNRGLQDFTSIQHTIDSTRRVMEYAELIMEDQSGIEVPDDWPVNGKIDVRNLDVEYAKDQPLVLRGISFVAEHGQRLAFVGRTGSGKSSLTLALLRLLNVRNGSVEIGGIDISTIKAADLRSRISIIPQDPVLFSGTIRSNLDYFSRFDDSVLEHALRFVHLTSDSGDKTFTLDTKISEEGSNLSAGQRQLLYLAKILIQKPNIMILDEATSAVDVDTEKVVQEAILRSFSGTLIVVAHRLSTVMAFDRIAVMDDGRIVEWGSPRELIARKGAFWHMLEAGGDGDADS